MTAREPLSPGSARPPRAIYDVALLDLDGVVYVGSDAVEGVPEALAAARRAGMRLGFVTNNAARSAEGVAAHLTELGVPAEATDVITSSQAAASVVVARWGRGARVLPVGGEGVAVALRAAGLTVVERAEDDPVAVVQGYGREVGWTQLAEAVVAIRNGARHVATNTDSTIPSPRGPLPGNGAMVGVVQGVTGQAPLVTGKPDPAMHEECVRRTGAQRPLVVGDRLDTDIEGARRAGADSMLVLTGVTDPEALLAAAPVHRPDLLAQDAAGLLVPHPAVVSDGSAFRCGSWSVRAAEADGVLVLCAEGSAGDDAAEGSAGSDAAEGSAGSDPAEGSAGSDSSAAAGGDGLDGLRALCVAHWARHPNDGAPARVLPDGDQAVAALRRWGLSTGE